MKKYLTIIIILLIIIAIGVTAIFFINHDDNPGPVITPTPTITETPGPSENVIVKNVYFQNKTENSYIDCIYPSISSLKNKEFENYINEEIAREIKGYINEIGFLVDEETPITKYYSYTTKYDRYNNGKYLSLVIDKDYQTGGIRSNKWKDIYNINAVTERLFYLDELFEPGVKYEEAIIAEITKQAEAKSYELKGGNGITKLFEKQKFYIKDEKLVIYFDPSEVSATVFGELHFEMPFTMNEDGYFQI